jgi:TRAP-type C4-dicarboxylate transport system substrate-binding protein
MKPKRSLLISAFLPLVLLLAALPFSMAYAGAPTPDNPMILNYEYWLPAAVKDFPVIQKFYKGLEDVTAGAVKTKFHTGGTMGPGSETYDRVIGGISDVGQFGPGYTPGVFPMFSIFDLPIHFPSAEVMAKAEIEMYKKGYFDKELSRVKVLGFLNVGPYVLFSAKKRVTTVKDFAGLKIRCPSEGWVQATKALGAIPVTTTSGEVYIALEKGITDANWMPWDGVYVYKLNEICKYVTEILMTTFPHMVVMNKKTWEALPKSAKDYIEQNWIQNSLNQARGYDAGRRYSIDVFSKTPNRETLHLAPGEWQKIDPRFTKIWDNWISKMEARGFPAKKAVDDLYSILKNLGVQTPIVGYTPGKY